MREPNSHLAQARERKEAFLPEIARLSLEGHTSREVAEKVGIPKTTVLRWRNSLRRDCASRSVKETMEMIDKLNERYDTIYRKARGGPGPLAGRRGNSHGHRLPRRRFEKQAPRPHQDPGRQPRLADPRQAALDATAKLLKEMGMPAAAENEQEDEPVDLTPIQHDDLKGMSDVQLAALGKEIDDQLRAERAGEKETAGVHALHEAGLPGELAPQAAGGEAGPGGGGPLPAADDLPPPATRQKRAGEPPLPGVRPGRNPELRLIGSSHTNDLATSMNRDVQRIICDNDAILDHTVLDHAEGVQPM